MMQTVFDKPQWKWVRDDEPREYGGFPNTVEVSHDHGGKIHFTVLVVLPTELFKFLKDMGVEEVETLYLEQQKKRWIFGVETQDKFIDLWYYTASTRPMWSMEHFRI